MTDQELIKLSRLLGVYILAASSDSPALVTADVKGYGENFMMSKAWQEYLAKNEAAILASVNAGGGAVPSPGSVPAP